MVAGPLALFFQTTIFLDPAVAAASLRPQANDALNLILVDIDFYRLCGRLTCPRSSPSFCRRAVSLQRLRLRRKLRT